MFSNIDENILWRKAPANIKLKDKETIQMEYLGEDRGQTERYYIALGRGVKDYFNAIESIFSIDDPTKLSNSKLNALLEKRGINFLKTTDENKSLIIHILENLNEAYRLKGTERFYKWIIHKFFGWVVLKAYSIESLYLILSNYNSFLYDNGEYLAQNYMYDNNPIDLSKITIVVDAEDPFLEEKKGLLFELSKSWSVDLDYVFIEG